MDKIISRMRNKVVKDNFREINSKPLLNSHMRDLKEHISKVFTHDIFMMIKGLIEFQMQFVILKYYSYYHIPTVGQ